MKINRSVSIKPEPMTAMRRPPSASLLAAIEAVSGELERQPLLKQAVQHACALFEADLGVVGLVDPNDGTIHYTAVHGVLSGEAGLEMTLETGLAGQVLSHGKPLVAARYGDVAQSRYSALADYAVLGVPLRFQERVLGFLGLGLAPPRHFTPGDTDIAEQFARYLAIALNNAHRFERERHRAARLATINHINRLIANNLDPERLLQPAVDAIAAHLHYPNVALLLVDPERPDSLVLRASSGLYAEPGVANYRQALNEGIIGAAARSQQDLVVNNVQQDPRYIAVPQGQDIRAELAVPIVVDHRLFGVLNIESERPFSEGDADDFSTIAEQLGLAIDQSYRFVAAKNALTETQLLYQTSQRIGMALNVPEVIEAYLEQVAAQGRYACNVVLYEFDEAGQRTSVVVYGRWTPQEGLIQTNERYAYSRDALDPLLDAGETVMIADVYHDPRVPDDLRQIQTKSGRPAIALIPLMVSGRRLGSVVLSAPVVHEWQETDLQPYQATAAQLATAIDSRHQRQLLYERGQQLAVLEERQRLARDLHDSVTQLIFSITLIAQSISAAWRRDPAEGERRVNRLLELSQVALAEMRALLAELRPRASSPAAATPAVSDDSPPEQADTVSLPLPGLLQIQRHGLPAAIRKYVIDVVGDPLKTKIEIETDHYQPQSSEREKALYRIAQEALNNIIKHAEATQATIRLHSDEEATYLTVTDNGVGFVKPSAPTDVARSGLGMNTMRERAEACGGTLHLSSQPGRGTTVAVTLPADDVIFEKG